MARKEKQDVKEPLNIGILRIHNTFRYLTVLPEETYKKSCVQHHRSSHKPPLNTASDGVVR